MKNSVSKERARKIRTREKQAGRVALDHLPRLQQPVYGLALALALWLMTVLLLNIEQLLGGDDLTSERHVV